MRNVLEEIRRRHNIQKIAMQNGLLAVFHGDAEEDWVTINGTHVLIDENGTAQGGGKLKGMTFSNAKSNKKKNQPPKNQSQKTPTLSELKYNRDAARVELKNSINTLSDKINDRLKETFNGLKRKELAPSVHYAFESIKNGSFVPSKFADRDPSTLTRAEMREYIEEQSTAIDEALKKKSDPYNHYKAESAKAKLDILKSLAEASNDDYEIHQERFRLYNLVDKINMKEDVKDSDLNGLGSIKDSVTAYKEAQSKLKDLEDKTNAKEEELKHPTEEGHKPIPEGSVPTISDAELKKRKSLQKEINAINKVKTDAEKELKAIETEMKKNGWKYSWDEWQELKAKENQARDKYYSTITEQQNKLDKLLRDNGFNPSHGVREKAMSQNITYNHVKPLKFELNDEEIAMKLAGGDDTKGSCASLALAFAANRIGLDVTDFRGGSSQNLFSKSYTLEVIAEKSDKNSVILPQGHAYADDVDSMLSKMKPGKEYYFTAACHAAIMRVTEQGQMEYLEMQSGRGNNGWRKYEGEETLVSRFGYKTKDAHKYDSVLFDIETLKGNKDFADMMGYINTKPDKQKKSEKGDIK